MRIEKISDNQIRCTLSKADLIDRQLRLSELAYGTDKAKALFRDMMQQANCEFGFEADDIPLMIEAIPVSPECLVLVITKIDDPDELDTRFSRFTASPAEESGEEDAYADEILNCFDTLGEILDTDGEEAEESPSDGVPDFTPLAETLGAAGAKNGQAAGKNIAPAQTDLVRIYSFGSLKEASRLARLLRHVYKGDNTLYKDPVHSRYYLVIHKSDHSPEEFNKICNIISEFGRTERTTYASPAYYEEHFEVIVRGKALRVLARL